MEIIYDYPPNYESIAQAFDIRDSKTVIFTYGNKLYVPAGKRILLDKPLMRHEETHGRQQKIMGIEAWWERYLQNPAFRLSQELEAYRNQYRHIAGMELQERLEYLDHIAGDLAGAMYGNLMSKEEAKGVITEGIILKHKTGSKPGANRKLKKMARQNRKKGRK